MSILHVHKIQTGKVWVAANAENFYTYNMQVYTGKTDGPREKNKGLQIVKGMVCQTYGTRTGVTADNFLTSCELAYLSLTRNMTLVGTLRENKSEIPALFLSGKQKEVSSSIFGFSNDLTWVSHVPARNKAVILHSSQHHDDICMGEEKDHKSVIFMHNVIKSVFDVLDQLVREWTCMRSTTCWCSKLFSSFTDVAGVNSFVLWMLK